MITLLNPEQATRAISLCWNADRLAREKQLPFRVPCCLVGGYGTGKTEAVRAFHRAVAERMRAQNLEFHYWNINLSMKESSEIGGIPVPSEDGKSYKYLTPPEMPFDNPTACGILFADEIDRAREETLNAYLQILLGGEVHEHRLAPNVYNVAAMNGNTDIYTTPLSGATRTRMCFIYVGQDQDLSSYMKWSKDVGIPEVIREFRRTSADLMQKSEPEEMAICVPRTLDMAGIVLEAAKRVKFKTSDILLACIDGCIGRAAAVKLMAQDRILATCPTFDEIVADPSTAKVPDELSLLNGVKSSYIIRATSKEACARLTQYVMRLPDEARVCWCREMCMTAPSLVPQIVKDIATRL